MNYYICAYIVDNKVSIAFSDTNPIDHGKLPHWPNDTIVSAVVNGEYQDAGVVFPLLSWNKTQQRLMGLDFVIQEQVQLD